MDLPLRPSEAAVLAELIFEQAAGRPVTDDVRNRLTGQAAALGMASVLPHFASLHEDPLQSSAYYLAVDGLASGIAEPLLLHLAPATGSDGGLLPKPRPVGRMRPGGGREILINASAFGPGDHQNISLYAESVGRCFRPRPQGVMPALRVELAEPARVAQAAFQAFRSISQLSGPYAAAILLEGRAEPYWETVWAAIRTGYRDGYTAGGPWAPETSALFTYFTTTVEAAGELSESLLAARNGAAYDLEIDLTATPMEQLQEALDGLRARGQSACSALIAPDPATLHAACAAVAASGAIPVLRGGIPSDEFAAAIRAATNGQLIYSTPFSQPDTPRLMAILEALR
ncbi:MAG TPA: hypothetical protein VGK29_17655 [Paludibaculum sp.]|jgi:hypothetical protein